ncbi:unnamed protein product [Rotaria sp. Silwood2]|nr:unnamed protein product [Rotaria sp. Silwood2]CAF3481247.1 unnamed protein product [Rotaria sp. Silwood2]CAF4558728.1 unnamed protein product [Rotaria sp. Silwood2]CAF4565617.1 unnamed protein product [Rotaria sp. Silwood2]CAF4668343.1 unnamed protein product [Rotaria sp. Silwood2]
MISKEMADTYGLIIVGNSGVGKSFLANIILGKQYFKHDFSARSVTHRTESITCILGDKHYRIYNIPGLIEGDEERISLNRHEISRAFEEQKEHSLVVIYVFGHQNGRIRNEDVVTFQAIHNAYTFNPDSLITIVNALPSDRPNTYNENTQATLIDLLGMKPGHICFIDRLKLGSIQEERTRTYLIDTILNVHPRIHIKNNDISLMADNVLKLQADLDMMQIKLYTEQYEHEDVIASMGREIESAQRVSTLQRLFVQAKANLRRLVSFREQQEHLMSVIGQWEAEEIRYVSDPTSDLYILARISKLDAQEQLTKNFTTQHHINVSLTICRKDIEQICFELEQIYDGRFDRECEPIREYYILLDNLRFDSTVIDVKHDFINDLYAFTCLRFGNIE